VGDRANFVFVQDNGETIVLYGHWAGYNMLEKLADAVAKSQPRWADAGYATRIVVSQMINEFWDSETGWGLYVNEIGDNEHRIPVVNFKDRTFSLHQEDRSPGNKVRGMSNDAIFTMDLSAFVEKYSDAKVLV
jgi:hypothetical protein